MAKRKWYSDTTLRKPATHPPNSGKFPSQPLPRQQAQSTSHKTYPQQPSVTRLMGHIGKETCKVIYDTSYIVLTIHPNSYSLNASTFIAHLRAHQNIYSLRQISSVSYVHGSLADVIAADPSPTNCLGPISPFTSPPVFLPLHSPFFAHPHYLRLLLTPPQPPSPSLPLPACLQPSLPQPPSLCLPPTLPPSTSISLPASHPPSHPSSLPPSTTHPSVSLSLVSFSISFFLFRWVTSVHFIILQMWHFTHHCYTDICRYFRIRQQSCWCVHTTASIGLCVSPILHSPGS